MQSIYHPIPPILASIADFLKSKPVNLSSRFSDGRINSSINEDEIIKTIKQRFNIDVPRARAWYDFVIESGNDFYPVNVKVTDTNHADNLNCKLGIYYALTGLLPDFPNEINWLAYFEKLKENLGNNTGNDYFFLVYNKQDSSDVFISKLKGLKKLQPNGNNLPFQCRWDENREIKDRTFKQAEEFLLSVFGESIKLRAEIYFNFKRLFPNYV